MPLRLPPFPLQLPIHAIPNFFGVFLGLVFSLFPVLKLGESIHKHFNHCSLFFFSLICLCNCWFRSKRLLLASCALVQSSTPACIFALSPSSPSSIRSHHFRDQIFAPLSNARQNHCASLWTKDCYLAPGSQFPGTTPCNAANA